MMKILQPLSSFDLSKYAKLTYVPGRFAHPFCSGYKGFTGKSVAWGTGV